MLRGHLPPPTQPAPADAEEAEDGRAEYADDLREGLPEGAGELDAAAPRRARVVVRRCLRRRAQRVHGSF